MKRFSSPSEMLFTSESERDTETREESELEIERESADGGRLLASHYCMSDRGN